MKYSENALNILTVRSFPQKGPAWIDKNLHGDETLSVLYQLLETNEYEFMMKRDRIESAINQLGNSIDGLVAIGDVDFPSMRGVVKPTDKPFALFYKGNISLLSKHNATIISGLALGCDSIAHKTALERGGKTIAILPSTLDNISPKENIELAERIVEEGGLLISEYYEAPKSRNDMISRFVVRDRLQALFSDAVLLAASYAPNNLGNDCGSRHAMEKAKVYGIKRGVIYNESKHRNIAMYDLNRQILAEDRSVIRIDSTNMSEAVLRLVTKSNEQMLF